MTVNSRWCYAVGDQVIPGMSEWTLPVAKEEEVARPCLMEGVLDPGRVEGVRVTPEVGDGSHVVHWVWIINTGPDSLVVYDGQVVGQWELVEEAREHPEDPGREQKLEGIVPGSGRREEVLRQLAETFGNQLEVKEREEALRTLGQYAEVF